MKYLPNYDGTPKVCSCCGVEKSTTNENFSPHNQMKSGVSSVCKLCANKRTMKSRNRSLVTKLASLIVGHTQKKGFRNRNREPLVLPGIESISIETRNIAQRLLDRYGTICLCGDELTSENVSVDHKVSISRDGKQEEENLMPICKRCNFAKQNDLLEDYIAWLNRIKTRPVVVGS